MQAKVAPATMPPNAIDELQTSQIDIAKLRAIEEAARASVVIAYASDAAPRMTMDGAPLPDREERSYDAQAQLIVPGIGTITLWCEQSAPKRQSPGAGGGEAAARCSQR